MLQRIVYFIFFMTFSDENAQLWEGGKGMLILIVWVSKFNESTLYIYIYIAKFIVIHILLKLFVWEDI